MLNMSHSRDVHRCSFEHSVVSIERPSKSITLEDFYVQVTLVPGSEGDRSEINLGVVRVDDARDNIGTGSEEEVFHFGTKHGNNVAFVPPGKELRDKWTAAKVEIMVQLIGLYLSIFNGIQKHYNSAKSSRWDDLQSENSWGGTTCTSRSEFLV